MKQLRSISMMVLIVTLGASCGREEQELVAPAPKARPERPLNYHALVIGVSEYDGTGWPALGTARSDAESVGQVLSEQYRFNVTRLLDGEATRGNILRALDRCMQLTEDDALLIYFAGHGYYDKQMDEGYWIPYGARKERHELPAKEDWLWNSSISRVVSASPARHVLLIADTCYGGSLFRGDEDSEKSGHWYKRAARTPSRYLITSGNLEPVLDSGIRHSVFAQEILNYLQYTENEIFSASDVAVSIRDNVSRYTGQLVRMGPLSTPSHAGGEFVFMRGEATMAPEPMPSSAVEPVEHPEMRGNIMQIQRQIQTLSDNLNDNFIRPRILACIGPTGKNEDETALIRSRLHSQLSELGGCILVEREDFESLENEIELSLSGRADQRAAAEIGKLLPASLILFGEILPLGEHREIHLRVTDTETSRVLSSVTASYNKPEDLDAACKQLAFDIMEAVNEARPVMLPALEQEGGLLQADWGRYHGARTGDSFEIIQMENAGTVSQQEISIGRAVLLNLGEESAEFRPEWSGEKPGSATPLWLKSAL